MNKVITISLIQQSCSKDLSSNAEKTAEMIREAKAQGAQLVLLPELHRTLYFCQVEDPDYFDLAEPIPGPSCQYYAAMAKELGIVIVSSLFERRIAGIYHNTAVVFERDGSIAGRYRKMHIPDDPGFYEKFYFTPGDLGFEPIETSLGKLGVLICWDQWFPEAARLMALKGADILIYPTAIGWDPDDDKQEKKRQLAAWKTIQKSHAISNGIPVAAINRTGYEVSPDSKMSGIDFWGHSFIVGPQGEDVIAAKTKEGVYTGSVDLSRSESVRRIWPFLRDRRIDAYASLNKRCLDQ